MAAVAAQHLAVSLRAGFVRVEVAETPPGLTNTARIHAPQAFWLEMSPADARRVAAALTRVCDGAARERSETTDV